MFVLEARLVHGSWCEGSPVNTLAAQYGPVLSGWDVLEVEQGFKVTLSCCVSLLLLPWNVLAVFLHGGLKRGKLLEFRASLNKFHIVIWKPDLPLECGDKEQEMSANLFFSPSLQIHVTGMKMVDFLCLSSDE